MADVNFDLYDYALNLDTDSVVLLPLLDNKLTSFEGVSFDPVLDIHVIKDRDYEAILDEYEVPEVTEDLIRDFFVARCNKSACFSTPIISDKGYQLIWETLVDAGFSDKDMIEQMPRILITWHEDEPKDILYDADLYDEDADTRDSNQLTSDAIDYIMADDFKSYYDCYTVNDKEVILYSAS